MESVAWIFQRRGLLATVFSLLSIICYCEADAWFNSCQNDSIDSQRPLTRFQKMAWYASSLLVFVMAMLSKGTSAVVPLVLALIAWWRRRRLTRADLLQLAPFLLIAGIFTCVNIWFQTHGSGEVLRTATLAERIAGAGATPWFYLSKAVLPIDLILNYPGWKVQTRDLRWWLPLAGGIVCTIVLWNQRSGRVGAALAFAWLFFCLVISPVAGFVDVGYMSLSLVADRYEQFAMIGVAGITAAGWSYFHNSTAGATRKAIAIAGVLVTIALATATWERCRLFGATSMLFADTLEKNPASWMAHMNLGIAEANHNQLDQALRHFMAAIALEPGHAEAYNNAALLLEHAGRTNEAIEYYRLALEKRPNYPEAENNFGCLLVKLERPQEGKQYLEAAVKANPDYADAHCNLGSALAQMGMAEGAIAQFREAIRINPGFAMGWYNLGNSLLNHGDPSQSLECYQRALRLTPEYAEAHYNLGIAYARLGRLEDAVAQFQEALRWKPDFEEARHNLDVAKSQLAERNGRP